jgi:hypothetical protein
MHQAPNSYRCTGPHALDDLQAGRMSKEQAREFCEPFTDLRSVGVPLFRAIPFDAEDAPHIMVCGLYPANPPEKARAITCGYTLARWLVDERGQPIPLAQIQAAARSATMADVRRLP